MLASAPSGPSLVALKHRTEVGAVPNLQADLTNLRSTMAAVRRVKPSLIVHAAYAHERAAIVDATGHLVEAACEVGADVLVVSTDAVFAGDGTARDEESHADPIWPYGQWKSDAERIVIDRLSEGAVVRLPLLVSIDPDDHVVRVIRASAARGEVTRWFTDETRQPALASEIAPAIWAIARLASRARSGTWHLAGAERLTRFEIALRVTERLGLRRNSVQPTMTPEDALRPRHIMMTDERARLQIGWEPSPVLT